MARPAVILVVLASFLCPGCSKSTSGEPSSGEPALVAQPELAPRERRAESWYDTPTGWGTLLQAKVRSHLQKPVTVDQLRAALDSIPDVTWTVDEKPSLRDEPQVLLTLITPHQKGNSIDYCPYHLLLRWVPSTRQITEYSFLVDFY